MIIAEERINLAPVEQLYKHSKQQILLKCISSQCHLMLLPLSKAESHAEKKSRDSFLSLPPSLKITNNSLLTSKFQL